MTLGFGDCEIDLERRELWRAKRAVHVEPQVFDLLVYLVQNRDRVVSKDDLIASVWGGRIVSESTLTSRINAARNAVGDSGRKQQLIRTIPRKGLRFIGAVQTQVDDNTPNQATDPPPDEIRDVSRPALLLPDRPAIAVLPFTNMSGDPEQEYFSDGISEDIITALSKLRWFFVIARNSSFVYKGKAVHMKQVAEELGVGYVVEGSVRKSGDRVRIMAQLNDVSTGSHIWGGTLRPRPCRRFSAPMGAGRICQRWRRSPSARCYRRFEPMAKAARRFRRWASCADRRRGHGWKARCRQGCTLRVRPETSGRIAEFSEHEAD